MSDTVPIFDGILKDGKPKVLGRERYKFDKYLRMIPDGTFLDIIIRKHEEAFDDGLRCYYFGIVLKTLMHPDVACMDKESLHLAMKEKFASYRDEKTGLLIIKKMFSDPETPVSVKEEFVQNVILWAESFWEGLHIPRKGEAYYD